MSRERRNNPANPAPANPTAPTTHDEFLKEAWKLVKPNSRKKSPTEDEVLDAIETMANDNRAAVAAGREQPKLLEDAAKKAREEQAKKDKEELDKLKAAHAKELEELKAAHKKELEDLRASQPAPGAGEEPDLGILSDMERTEYDSHVLKGTDELAAASAIMQKALRRKTARRLVGLF